MGKLSTLKKLWQEDKNSIFSAVFNNLVHIGVLNCLPDKLFLQIAYRLHIGKKLNLDNPKTFNEKLQWLKLNDRNSEYSKMVDKYLVKEYVENVLGEEVIIPTLGVWESADQIEFEKLPEKFVLKCNHDSGGIVICKNKSELDRTATIEKLSKCLKKNGYWYGREWPYKNVKPCIIAEEYIVDSDTDLKDYKFFCFNGRIRCFKVDFNRYTNHRANYYDSECTLLPFGEVVCPPDYNHKIVLPDNINEMMAMAEKLAIGIPFVRVDFYNVDGRIFFGEMTFYPASGFGRFIPGEWDEKIGSWLQI